MTNSGAILELPSVSWSPSKALNNFVVVVVVRNHLNNLKLDLKASGFFSSWRNKWVLGTATTDYTPSIKENSFYLANKKLSYKERHVIVLKHFGDLLYQRSFEWKPILSRFHFLFISCFVHSIENLCLNQRPMFISAECGAE